MAIYWIELITVIIGSLMSAPLAYRFNTNRTTTFVIGLVSAIVVLTYTIVWFWPQYKLERKRYQTFSQNEENRRINKPTVK